MNDLVATAHVQGEVRCQGSNIYAADVDPVEVRRRIGMVFQKPNPFPKSICKKVALGAQINRFSDNMDELVESSLQQAARASDFTAFFDMDEDRAGYLVAYGIAGDSSTKPRHELTEQYITGRFG